MSRQRLLVQVVELHDAERTAAERTIDDHQRANLARGESQGKGQGVEDVLRSSDRHDHVVAASCQHLVLGRGLKSHIRNTRAQAAYASPLGHDIDVDGVG